MQITDFNDFLLAARAQDEPQRLLLVFAARELPLNHTPGQKKRFEAGQGGALAPVMCVDKAVDELPDFATLARESQQTGQPWDVAFVAALPGIDGALPTAPDVERALKMMIDAVHRGAIERFLAFDADGKVLRLT
ncbi:MULTISPECIES: ribonucleotide reductase subunit alpha [Massilia]|uniref:Ribonucleotide reductase subunit alpha n=1 Tax=Massilia aurea TaxID=373040 RepID=A0A422QJY5_9BURK|nr:MULTISPECIES: ribonucleotide reductase subunit alpha [Massilia]MDY0960701.1 ribonucleotide reductase subunit alpha [Massilia sp. CFBP9026]RNF30131.1 ribonucleotide reductase subunit alpha [Massilia aurea]